MNLSELLHRSADDSPSVVHSTYDHHHDPFQPATATTTDAMQLYNNEVLESSRFITTKNNDEAIYSPSKALPMSSPTTSSSSWHYNSTMGESSRSPYASTLSDQSDRPRLLLPDSPPPASSNTITSTGSNTAPHSSLPPPPLPQTTPSTTSSSSSIPPSISNNTTTTTTTTTMLSTATNTNTNNNHNTMLIARGTTGAGVIVRGDTPASTDSPASPIPMDRSSSSSPPPGFTTESSPEFQHHHHHHHSNNNHHDDNSIANLYARKNNNQTPILTITGETVTKDNIEEGYVQFVLHHDPQSINDSIESLMYVKRKFSSVPKTGDLSYTTWDVFTLVKKLHNQQIKNWSQLVGQLGLSDMTGRPQFAQRVKRWMRKYRIDCYFDYLLGNPYNFHSPDEKNTGCLMMGNYQKRNKSSKERGTHTPPIGHITTNDETDSVKSSGSNPHLSSLHGRTRKRSRYYLLTDEDDDEEEEDENGTTDDEEERRSTPIVLAGSRKRARLSPHQHVSTESLRFSKALQENHQRLSELENQRDRDDDDEHYHRDNNDLIQQDQNAGKENNHHHLLRHEEEEEEDDIVNDHDHHDQDDEMEDGDEEDELASTSSSSTISQHNHRLNFNSIHATLITTNNSTAITNSNTTTTTIPSILNNTKMTTAGPSSLSRLPSASTSSCSNCTHIQGKVDSLENDMALLKEQVATLQTKLDQEIQSKQTMEKQLLRFESMCAHYDKWRTQLAAHLLQNPFRSSDLMDLSSTHNHDDHHRTS